MGRRKRNNREFWNTIDANTSDYFMYLNRLTELSLSMFNWSGVPDTVDIRFMELQLFNRGSIAFFYDETIGYLALPYTANSPLDVYGEPVGINIFANNGYTRTLDNTNSVIIHNNYLHTNTFPVIENFAKQMYEFDQIISVNARAQKTPVLIKCEETQRLALRNLCMKVDGNEPWIFGTKDLPSDAIDVFKTDAPYICDKIYDLKTKYWNEALTYLGISNVSYSKKERMTVDEISRTLGGTVASRYSRLEARREAAEKINKMFGLNVSCDYKEDMLDIESEKDEAENDDLEGGETFE